MNRVLLTGRLTRDPELRTTAGGKAVALIEFLAGVSLTRPTPGQARAVGAALAQAHLAARDFGLHRANALGPRTRMVAVGLASNAVGTINPIRRIADMPTMFRIAQLVGEAEFGERFSAVAERRQRIARLRRRLAQQVGQASIRDILADRIDQRQRVAHVLGHRRIDAADVDLHHRGRLRIGRCRQ